MPQHRKAFLMREMILMLLLSELEKYQSDSVRRIRSKAYNLSSRFAQISEDESLKTNSNQPAD